MVVEREAQIQTWLRRQWLQHREVSGSPRHKTGSQVSRADPKPEKHRHSRLSIYLLSEEREAAEEDHLRIHIHTYRDDHRQFWPYSVKQFQFFFVDGGSRFNFLSDKMETLPPWLQFQRHPEAASPL